MTNEQAAIIAATNGGLVGERTALARANTFLEWLEAQPQLRSQRTVAAIQRQHDERFALGADASSDLAP